MKRTLIDMRPDKMKPTNHSSTELKTEALKVGTTMDVAVNPILTVNAAYWAGKEMSGKNWKAEA